MRPFMATFWMGFKYLWINPASSLIVIIFPIILILILGTALSSYISVETDIEPARIAVYADSEGMFAQFLRSGEISRFIEAELTGQERAKELVESGDVCAALFERDGKIDVLRAPGGGIQTDLVLSVVDSYVQIGSAAAIAAARGMNAQEALGAGISVRDVPLGKRVPNAIDYYAVTMLVMILLYTGMNATDMFDKALLGSMGNRIRLSPIPSYTQIGALLAASSVTSFLQGMVTFIFTAVVYGVYWGERIPLVLATLFAVVLLSESICLFLLMLVRKMGAVTGIVQAIFWLSTFVSSGYSKISFGEADKIFQYAPNALAHNVIFGAVYGGNEGKMMFSLALLFATGIVFFVLAFILGRRRIA